MTIFDVPIDALPAEGEVAIVDIGSLTLENGAVIDDVSIAVQRWGELSPNRDNVVVVLHALTGDSHITGPAGPGHPTAGLVGRRRGARRADRHRPVVRGRHQRAWAAAAGRPGPSSLARDGKPWGSRFPLVTVRDQVEADVAALAALGITEVAAVVGGSMGGARALEWMSATPTRSGRRWCWPSGLARPPTRSARRAARSRRSNPIRTGSGGDYYGTGRSPDIGMEIARRFAHLTYRGEDELDDRFGNDGQDDEDPGDRRPLRGAELPGASGAQAAAQVRRGHLCRADRVADQP